MNPEEHGIDPAYLSENDRKMLSATAEVEDSAAQSESVKTPMAFDELEELFEVVMGHYNRADMWGEDDEFVHEAQAAIIAAEPIFLQGLQNPETCVRTLTMLKQMYYGVSNGALYSLPVSFTKFLRQNMSLLESIMEGNDSDARHLVFDIVYAMLRSKEKGVDKELFLRHLDTIKRSFTQEFYYGGKSGTFSWIVEYLMEASLEEQDMETLRDIGRFIINQIDLTPVDVGESLLLKLGEWIGRPGKVGDIAYDMTLRWLEKYDLDMNHLYDTAWGTIERSQQGQAIGANLQRIKQIESRAPGAARTLLRRFGIKHFGRYPSEMLLEQHWERDNTELRYGIILYPTHDYNGAFHGDEETLRDMYRDLNGELLVRIVECEGKFDIGRTLIGLDQQYGSEHKIAFAIIGGHGDETGIVFGGPDARHILHVDDLAGRGIGRTNQFFEPNPSIVLISCSTGAKEAIGQQLSAVMKAKLIAPEVPTSLDRIVATVHDGKVDFQVKYTERNADRTYVRGQHTKG